MADHDRGLTASLRGSRWPIRSAVSGEFVERGAADRPSCPEPEWWASNTLKTPRTLGRVDHGHVAVLGQEAQCAGAVPAPVGLECHPVAALLTGEGPH
jgi:hypothetical protein